MDQTKNTSVDFKLHDCGTKKKKISQNHVVTNSLTLTFEMFIKTLSPDFCGHKYGRFVPPRWLAIKGKNKKQTKTQEALATCLECNPATHLQPQLEKQIHLSFQKCLCLSWQNVQVQVVEFSLFKIKQLNYLFIISCCFLFLFLFYNRLCVHISFFLAGPPVQWWW